MATWARLGDTTPVLGSLEAAVLDHLWENGSSDAKATHRAVGTKRRITLNTIQSAMERLHRKGLLARRKVSHAYVYSPSQTREQFAARLVEGVVESVLGGNGTPLLLAFLNMAERLDSGALSQLEQAIAARRSAAVPSTKG